MLELEVVEWQPAEPGVHRKILTIGKNLMNMVVEFKTGAEGYVHSHPHEQLTYVLKGVVEFILDGEVYIIHQNESIYIPGGTAHGVKALTEALLLDTFTPLREDLLAKDNA
jgi:quercetin dioxygenase-like cupin family protein